MKQWLKIKTLIQIIYQISPAYIFLLIFGSLLGSIQTIINVVLPKFLLEELLGTQRITFLLWIGGGIVGANLLFHFIQKTTKRLLDVQNEDIRLKITEHMAKKIMDVEYRYLEDPYYLDLKERALFACNNQSALANMINHLSRFVANFFTITGLIIIMFSLHWILVAILLVGILATLIISSLFRQYQTKFFQGILPLNRKYGYYLNLSFDYRIAKDMRLFNMSKMLMNRVRSINKDINDEFKVYYRRQGITTGAYRIIHAIQMGIVYIYVSFRTFGLWGTRITIGDFTMYVGSAIQFTVAFNDLFTNIVTIFQMLDYLDPLLEFMRLKESKQDRNELVLGDIEEIKFENVSFQYPKSNEEVLKNISFVIHKGEKISIVGLNGAGKTTLIKLLCRFYQPTKGKIYINGLDIYAYDYVNYIKKIAAVFQDYKLFAFSVIDNVSSEKEPDRLQIERLFQQVSLSEKIAELSHGMDTVLNKAYDEDGTELSGGQGQKLAITRALYKKADLVILDEPTSSLDPLAEAEIYQHFNELVLSKTAIYISHRMSSSVFCDKVLVIDQGGVSDFAPHSQLMKKKNSLYYQLFSSQAKNYQL